MRLRTEWLFACCLGWGLAACASLENPVPRAELDAAPVVAGAEAVRAAPARPAEIPASWKSKLGDGYDTPPRVVEQFDRGQA
jgi:hypothetical protein